MLDGKTVAVVVPAFNEESQIASVVRTMPSFVDRIIIIDDCSTDKTVEVVQSLISEPAPTPLEIRRIKREIPNDAFHYADKVAAELSEKELSEFVPSEVVNAAPETSRIILIRHLDNGGVGAAIARGYKWCKDHGIDCTAVMAGDGQMDPSELESICRPIVSEGIDYVKGNRLIHPSAWLVIPRIRYFGNSVLSILTKIASGYWGVSDTQTGYTAISLRALNAIELSKIYRRYGMPNDLLVRLNIAFCTLKEVGIKPVYNVGEQSKLRIRKAIPRISFLLMKCFFRRLWLKYLIKNFHPLFLLYHFSFILTILWLPYLFKVGSALIEGANVSFETLFAFTFLGISGFQSLLFAMWMDIQDNERLDRT